MPDPFLGVLSGAHDVRPIRTTFSMKAQKWPFFLLKGNWAAFGRKFFLGQIVFQNSFIDFERSQTPKNKSCRAFRTPRNIFKFSHFFGFLRGGIKFKIFENCSFRAQNLVGGTHSKNVFIKVITLHRTHF